MKSKVVDCFLPYSSPDCIGPLVSELKADPSVRNVFLLTGDSDLPEIEGCQTLHVGPLTSAATVKAVASAAKADYTLLYTKTGRLQLGYLALQRFAAVAGQTGAGMLYSDSFTELDGHRSPAPVIDYQEGSLRDDFNFGSLLFFSTPCLKLAAHDIDDSFVAAGLYDLRLRLSRLAPIVRINEFLYTDVTVDNRKSGEKNFDYVDPRNRQSQIEMERACTAHLKEIGAYLEPRFDSVDLTAGDFPVEASVIIPVRNRVRTIGDAIRSVLSQKTSFPFNIIVVDNHSTDGTTEVIDSLASDDRIVHLIPDRDGLGIGGCWNLAVADRACGRFAVQLDSDDVYSSDDTLARIVVAFYDQNCAMVIGSYMLTDIDLKPVPPGKIDHSEWTPDNGRNNALRINGLGAPRAFFTPLLRQMPFPDTCYGEDYAAALAFSRRYRIGRIYDVLYYCRRWEGNSDAALAIAAVNANNLYKDRLRTWEISARRAINRSLCQ